MSQHRKNQSKFVLMQAMLVQYANLIGYELTFGDAWAKTGHKEGSFHYERLAIDFNLFIDDVYQEDTEAHRPLGEYWKSIGGTWGGDFKNPDGNHYSYGE